MSPAPTVIPVTLLQNQINQKKAPSTRASSNLSTPHTDYSLMLSHQTLMEDVLDSQKRIHDQGTIYLPKLTKQTDAQYESYKLRADFPLLTRHALTTFVGMTLRKDLMLENVPKSFNDNVDGTGRSLTAYAKIVIQQFLSFGRCLTLTEYTATGTNKRAKLVFYGYQSIINWKTRIVNDIEQLSMVVLKEQVVDPAYADDEFSNQTVAQYRVLSLDKETNYYRQRVFDVDLNLVSSVVPKKDRKPLQFIPAVIHGGVDLQKPPLLSIAEQNLSWYRIDADYKHGLHYTALPTPGTVGVDPDDENAPKAIGPTEIWYLPEGSSAFMLEFSGAGLATVAAAKNDISENIITLSSRILSPSTNINETATAASIRNAGETASLADIINMLSRELTLCTEFALNWDNLVTNIRVEINTDFIPTILSGGDAASYGAMVVKGTLSRRALFDVLKQGEIIAGDKLFEQEIKDIQEDLKWQDERDVRLAGDLAKAEADAQPAAGETEDGKVAPNASDNQGKNEEQSNKSQNQKEN